MSPIRAARAASVTCFAVLIACSGTATTPAGNGDGGAGGSGSDSGSTSSDAASSGSDAGAGADSGTVDAGIHDSGPRLDAREPDGGLCAPVDESGYLPSWVAPRAPSAKCTVAQLDSFFTCQSDAQNAPGATLPASCTPWSPATGANLTCAQCIDSTDTEATWGPLVSHKATHTIDVNFAGCFAIEEGKLDGSGCGGPIQASRGCAEAACSTNCPVAADGTGLDVFNQCISDAEQGTCSAFDAAANACFVADSGATAACLAANSDDFWGNARVVAGVFCGGL